MGAAVSDWRLAHAVAQTGQLGVVSGTGIDTVFARRLQDGDSCGAMRRAMARFPIPRASTQALHRFFRAGGRDPGSPYKLVSMYRQSMPAPRQELSMLAAFVEVSLAKEGHTRPIGINLLTKIQMSILPTLYGAMLAGVDYVLMGAGIPREVPGALAQMAEHREARLHFEIDGAIPGTDPHLSFDPSVHWDALPAPLRVPRFLPIVSSNSLATMLARKANGSIDGFIIEGATAGGHNAPPRGDAGLSRTGEPVYGARDEVDLARLKELGLPFWIAGGAGHPARLTAARAAGASGVQVGTLFAYCEESGLAPALKHSILDHARRGEVTVRTEPRVSPTGYPFKVATWPEDPSAGVNRTRVCDLGYLRTPYVTPDGQVGYRCSGEPEAEYVRKGGELSETIGRRCICNALLAAIGQPQTRADGSVEQPIVTSGDDLTRIAEFLGDRERYTAADVVDYLLGKVASPPRSAVAIG
ncbi:MAG: nitronate monooxygenase [Candidatus Eisenbacteria bacterium]|nr:nitronate monooxygenase [Candidatus Eisenbacteria bacterium]